MAAKESEVAAAKEEASKAVESSKGDAEGLQKQIADLEASLKEAKESLSTKESELEAAKGETTKATESSSSKISMPSSDQPCEAETMRTSS